MKRAERAQEVPEPLALPGRLSRRDEGRAEAPGNLPGGLLQQVREPPAGRAEIGEEDDEDRRADADTIDPCACSVVGKPGNGRTRTFRMASASSFGVTLLAINPWEPASIAS